MQESINQLVETVRAVIYARVSSEEQREGKTIDSQIKELEDFARANNYKIVERYIDDGWSGAILERPELDRLRDDATKNLFEVVLVNDVDRLSREMLHLGIVKRDLERKGIRLVFKKLPNSGDALSNFMINVLGSFAEFERQMIADRIRRGKRYKAEIRNLILGNIPPYGYDYVPKAKGREGYYKINKEEARIVRRMFKWVVKEGLSQREVVKRLVERKIPARKAPEWPKSSVHRALTNSTYIGVTYWNKHKATETKNRTNRVKYQKRRKTGSRLRPREEWIPIRLPKHLRIIDEKTFYAAQAQFQRNKCYASRNNKKENFYLLRGLLQCGLCGSPYVGNPCHGKLYYRCGNRYRTFPRPKECKAGMISAPKLESVVWNAVVNAIQNPIIITDQVKKFEERQRKQPSEIEQGIKGVEEELRRLETEEERLFKAYRKEVIQLSQFQREIDKLNGEKERLNLELKELESKKAVQLPEKQVIRSIKEYCRVLKSKVNQFSNEQKQAFLRLLLGKIILEGKKVRILGLIPVYTEPEEYKLLERSLQFNNLKVATFAGNSRLVPAYSGIALPSLKGCGRQQL